MPLPQANTYSGLDRKVSFNVCISVSQTLVLTQVIRLWQEFSHFPSRVCAHMMRFTFRARTSVSIRRNNSVIMVVGGLPELLEIFTPIFPLGGCQNYSGRMSL